LDGTRTFLVGSSTVAIIDPGPNVEAHVRALVLAVEQAETVRIVLTHGHGDHAQAAPALSAALRIPVWGPAGLDGVDHSLADGDSVETDAGRLVAVHTPGHTEDHLCFHWPGRNALFAGDLLLGEGDTTWVAEYPGCVADYLDSLARLRKLELDVIYPAHGSPLEDPPAALDRFENHRRERIRQVEEALAHRPDADLDDLLDMVYGGRLPDRMGRAAKLSLGALLDYVRTSGSR